MYAIIVLVFCVMLGVMVATHGIAALLWFPLGFAVALFVSAQIVLPLVLGLPRAAWLVMKRRMRPTILPRILLMPILWLLALFFVGFLWPPAVAFVERNAALNLGTWLGTVAIIVSPLSKKGRSDYREDFDESYGPYLIFSER